jgi:hypothetical protein
MDDVELKDVQREIRSLRERYERDREQRRENVERIWLVAVGLMFGFGLGLVVTVLFRPSACVQPAPLPPAAAPAR